MIVTFYSYKGGVGRSMALVNVAELLADAGYRVVACDFDLEAPGLERYFADDAKLLDRYRSRPGIIDLLDDYKAALAGGEATGGDGKQNQPDDPRYTSLNGLRVPRPSGYLAEVPSRNPRRRGSVALLTAGRRDGSWNQRYSERVQRFDWDDFYASWAGDVYLDLFREDLTSGGAVVLVDSRTGVTEQGGVCTHHLADLVVLMSAANDLNVAGTKWMAEVLSSDEVASMRRGRPLKVMPVAARIEVFSEVEELESFRGRFLDTFSVYVPHEVGRPTTFISESEIPYVPFYAFTERIVARQDELVQRELYDAYRALTRAVVRVGVAGRLLKPPTAPDWRDSVPEQPATGVEADLLAHRTWLESGGTLGRRAVLRGAVLPRHQLPEVNLRDANLAEAELEHANLRRADLRRAILSSALLGSADLGEATLEEAELAGADLTAAILVGASLRGAKLQGANLRRADLAGADVRDTDLTGAQLDGADLRGAKLDGAIGLTLEQLRSALTDDATRVSLPQPDEATTAAIVSPLADPVELRSRLILLKRVRVAWIEGVLDRSLMSMARLQLGLQLEPDAVGPRSELPAWPRTQLPAGVPIGEVFDQFGGALLILGPPGAGKTTLLLTLARELLDRAERDASHPIPAVFNLSSWADGRPLADWLVEELAAGYGVPRELGKGWVDSDRILPLLDGLDEVPERHRGACARAINLFREQHGLVPMALCSRTAAVGEPTVQLRLLGAVDIQPLTRSQVAEYLDQAGERLAGARAVLKGDPALWELLSSPLMLSILTLAYRDKPVKAVRAAGGPSRWRHELLDAYVETMLSRPGEVREFSSKDAVRWLGWLAGSLRRHGAVEFRPRLIRRDWLPPRQQPLLDAGVGLLVGLLVGLVLGLLVGLRQGMATGLASGLGAGLAAGLIAGLRDDRPAVLRPPWIRRWVRVAITGAVAGLATGAYFGAASLGLATGLAAALSAWLLTDGAAALRYLLLRALLVQGGCAPWRYVRFLDYAADRYLLRKVGERYIFVHRLLQEHFAELEAPDDRARPGGRRRGLPPTSGG